MKTHSNESEAQFSFNSIMISTFKYAFSQHSDYVLNSSIVENITITENVCFATFLKLKSLMELRMSLK
jgi:hypothetical protein